MKEQFQHLKNLVATLPSSNSSKSVSELSLILTRYTSILDFVNSYNAELKRATSVYYTDISNIRDNIQHSLYLPSQKQRDQAFEQAKKELIIDINALATLIQPEEVFTAVPA